MDMVFSLSKVQRSSRRAMSFCLLIMALLVLLGAAWGAVAGPLEDGVGAASRGDRADAVAILEPLAKGGNNAAAVIIGDMYERGVGGGESPRKAMQWYRIAANRGDPEGANRIAGMLASGSGVKKDRGAAIKWYELGAKQGYIISQFNLGMLYADDNSGEPDDVLAYMWLTLAAADQEPSGWSALDFREKIALRMTPAQIEEAQRKVDAWRSAH